MFSRKTKIVCSLGPAVDSDTLVENLILAGMNIARFNFSHGTHDEQKERMDRVKRCSEKLNRPVALMLDTKGPEIRTGNVKDKPISIHKGDVVILTVDGRESVACNGAEPAYISLSWKDFPNKATPGIKVLIADGLLELEVVTVDGEKVSCVAKNTGCIGSKKNVNIIGLHAGLPIMSETDKNDIAFGVSQNVDFIAASFVSFPHEIVEIRKYLESLGSKAKIIAKIENEEGLDNIKEIIHVADGVMVARGDMGVQLPTERIPLAQKYIIHECRKAGKPVITATQMLDSMITNPRPTRAELTDVANAIIDGTDAVMLSGETASGAYPIESVETMARIAITVETSKEYQTRMRETPAQSFVDINLGQTMARMAYLTATEVSAVVILVPTMSGNTARMISMYRPEQSILAVTPNPQVQRQMLLNWGVVPLLTTIADDSEEMVQNAIKIALDNNGVKLSDKVVMCAGIPLASPLMVNTIRIFLVGNVLAHGEEGGGNPAKNRVSGRIVRALSVEEAYLNLRKRGGEILVVPHIDESYIPILRLIDGVICQGTIAIPHDRMKLINPRLIWISEIHNAEKILENGLTVTLDIEQLLVYEGKI